MFRSKRRSEMFLNVLSYAIIGSVMAFALFPLLWTFLTSLKVESDIVTTAMQYIPKRATFDNSVATWQRVGLAVLRPNSALTSTVTILVCSPVGRLGAYCFSRYRLYGRCTLLLFYLVIRRVPVVLMSIPLFL